MIVVEMAMSANYNSSMAVGALTLAKKRNFWTFSFFPSIYSQCALHIPSVLGRVLGIIENFSFSDFFLDIFTMCDNFAIYIRFFSF